MEEVEEVEERACLVGLASDGLAGGRCQPALEKLIRRRMDVP